jgi:hypothetical protein
MPRWTLDLTFDLDAISCERYLQHDLGPLSPINSGNFEPLIELRNGVKNVPITREVEVVSCDVADTYG